jgi:hypothetical protein
MPAQYEHIRDSYIAAGKSAKEAKKLAAMTYNAHRKPGVAPVTGKPLGETLAGSAK